MPVPDFWPRLYLDTGDLIDIADGRIAPDVVRELTISCEEHAVLLVLSSAHLQDALMPEDPVSVDRLATALELFRLRCLVMKGPDVVEPWLTPGAAQDIEIEGCSNIRAILTYPGAAPNLASMREVQDALHRAALSSKVARQVIGDVPIPRHHRPIALQSTITQIRGWMGDDPAPVVLHHMEQDGGSPTANETVNLIMAQQPLTEVLREVSPLIDVHGFDRTELVRRMALSIASDGFKTAPGAWLAGNLQAGLAADISRTPLRSDSVDCLHAMHLPYVDIASCDAQSYAILSRHIRQAQGARNGTVSLFRNGRIVDIVAHIKSLPRGVELYASRTDDVGG